MHLPNKLTTLYLDFDAYFASVERQDNPERLANRPVGVIPFPSPNSGLIARCYLSKAAGCHRGMKCADALAACPDIALIPARHDVYVEYHHRIIAAIEKHLPVKKVWSVDEMECDFGQLRDDACIGIARDIADQIRTDIGPHVTPSIGLSANGRLAKIAAEMDKPSGFVVLHPRDLPGRLFEVELDDIPGIASRMALRLDAAGIRTVADLYRIGPKHARALWRSVEGERLWWSLHGAAMEPLQTQRAMFGHSRQLSGAWSTPTKAGDCLRLLCGHAARRLRKDSYLARTLSVSIKDRAKDAWSVTLDFAAARDDFTLQRQCRRAYAAVLAKARADYIRHVSVTLHGLVQTGGYSEELFDPGLGAHGVSRDQRRKFEAVSDIIDDLNAEYSYEVISLGINEQPPGGFAGGKIAFGRVPDHAAYMKRIATGGFVKARSLTQVKIAPERAA